MHRVSLTYTLAGRDPAQRDLHHPLMPLFGVALHAWTGQPISLALPLVTGYVLMPLLDALIGEDLNNPPEAVVPQLEADRYYRWLT